jgi:carotenoid cleavage dioxygenase
MFHAGKLFSLKESNLPTTLNPHTLETHGEFDFEGKLTGKTFTAHPKIDTRTGEMIAFGYEASGDGSSDMAIYFIDKQGKLQRELWFKAPVISMMHDMALTEKHIIIPTTTMVSTPERLQKGLIHWGSDATAPTYVAVIPRDGSAKDVRWFKGPPSNMVHTINAVTDGNRIILDAPVSNGSGFVGAFPTIDGKPPVIDPVGQTIRRWTFDLAAKRDTWDETTLFPNEKGGSLPRMDDRYISQPFRYSFMGYADPSKPFDSKRGGNLQGRITNVYGRFDHATGKVESFFAGDTHSLQEPCFVPRSKIAICWASLATIQRWPLS